MHFAIAVEEKDLNLKLCGLNFSGSISCFFLLNWYSVRLILTFVSQFTFVMIFQRSNNWQKESVNLIRTKKTVQSHFVIWYQAVQNPTGKTNKSPQMLTFFAFLRALYDFWFIKEQFFWSESCIVIFCENSQNTFWKNTLVEEILNVPPPNFDCIYSIPFISQQSFWVAK